MAEHRYRENALKNISSPKSLDDLIKVTRPKDWLILLALLVVAMAMLGWFFFGSITTRVEGEGILFAEEESIISIIAPDEGGYVENIQAKLGDKIQPGMVLANISNPALNNDIVSKKYQIDELQAEYDRLSRESEIAIKKRSDSIDQEYAFVSNVIKIDEQKEIYLYELLQTKIEAQKRGLITQLNVAATQVNYFNQLKTISDNKKLLLMLINRKNDYIRGWERTLDELKMKINDKSAEYRNLTGKMNLSQQVVSKHYGVVSVINKNKGDHLKKGEVFANLTTKDEGLEATIYIEAGKGKHVAKGMKAIVYPANVNKLEYGGMVGYVAYVSAFPTTLKSIVKNIKNESLTTKFLKQGPVLEVRIKLLKDKDTVSGVKWTTSVGPGYKITPGTLTSANILTRRQTPLSLFLPYFKKKTYWIFKP